MISVFTYVRRLGVPKWVNYPRARGGGAARGALCGLAAAALFGASAPLSKVLLPALSPLVLAGLLYLGAGLGLGLARLWPARGAATRARRRSGGAICSPGGHRGHRRHGEPLS